MRLYSWLVHPAWRTAHCAPQALLLFPIMIFLAGCGDKPEETPDVTGDTGASVRPIPLPPAPLYGYRVVRTIPHDIGAFTQGLLYRDGVFYESTGIEGESSLRKVDAESGQVLKKVNVPRPHFAEGMTILGGKIYQITWRSQTCLVYDSATLEKTGEHFYQGEGWGLTDDGATLIMSDGSSRLKFIDPAGFVVRSTITVTDQGRPVEALNELEWVEGEIWANIWQSDRIARIDPATGKVTGWIDLTGILPAPLRREGTDVLNGIAYDPATKRIFVTGKLWPSLFEIEVVPRSSPVTSR